jgi:hypothetical protein
MTSDSQPDVTTSFRAAPEAPQGGDQPGSANLDKVRDIIFGAQMRDYERRFARVEERLAKETADLSAEVRARLAALEEYVRRETESLSERIRGESDARAETAAGLSREQRESASALQRRDSHLEDQIGRAQRELRQQLLEQHQALSDEIRQRVEEVVSRLNRESSEIRADKADRATIAALLTEMAMRLKNELSVPGFDPPGHG